LYFLPSDGSKACQLAWLATTAIISRKRINTVEKQISATIDTVSLKIGPENTALGRRISTPKPKPLTTAEQTTRNRKR
jgi:hypothetical protein